VGSKESAIAQLPGAASTGAASPESGQVGRSPEVGPQPGRTSDSIMIGTRIKYTFDFIRLLLIPIFLNNYSIHNRKKQQIITSPAARLLLTFAIIDHDSFNR
jgi:hypothetical protein